MDDAMERVLRLVSEGRLTAEEAGPILDALAAPKGQKTVRGPVSRSEPGPGPGFGAGFSQGFAEAAGGESAGGREGKQAGGPRFARLEVREGGRRVVDLRIPISLGRLALGRVPGLSAQHVADVEEAVASGDRGPILDVEDADGDGVRIVLE